MTRPRLLDVYCGAGGATRGYQLAGFHVTGVDVKPMPRYVGEEFIQADALEVLSDAGFVAGFDAVHASPPCQAHSILGQRWPERTHIDLVHATRVALVRSGLPYVIENVPGAPLRNPTMLCGSGLGLPLRRHRLFECNFAVLGAPCAHGMWPLRYRIRQHGKEIDTAFCYVFGGGQAGQPVASWREAMGVDWMTVDELSQAIPPVYAQHVGAQLLNHIRTEALA